MRAFDSRTVNSLNYKLGLSRPGSYPNATHVRQEFYSVPNDLLWGLIDMQINVEKCKSNRIDRFLSSE